MKQVLLIAGGIFVAWMTLKVRIEKLLLKDFQLKLDKVSASAISFKVQFQVLNENHLAFRAESMKVSVSELQADGSIKVLGEKEIEGKRQWPEGFPAGKEMSVTVGVDGKMSASLIRQVVQERKAPTLVVRVMLKGHEQSIHVEQRLVLK
ncbi:hypothetical protein [Algivirga pacifica]|uniref:Late embryogenesis abundant protein LEA-2 subgroup domain-containing protein n=1 Tax=Algivirga pacifica TaxID=1162670 RepID=A0ABP9DKW3_9BACT